MILPLGRWEVTKSKHLFESIIIYLISNYYLRFNFSYHWCLYNRLNWISDSFTFWWHLLLVPSLPGIRPWWRVSISSPPLFLFNSDHLFSRHGRLLFPPLIIARPWSLMMFFVSFCTHIPLLVMPSFSFFRWIATVRRWSVVMVFMFLMSFFTLTTTRPTMMLSHVFIIVFYMMNYILK